jgi:hypothetical protein
MIKFLVIAAPRSGTAWCANWLTTDTTFCYHGLSKTVHHLDWHTLESDKRLGVSDPTLVHLSDWCNAQDIPKLIVHRNSKDIADALGMPELKNKYWGLDKFQGMHIEFEELFKKPKQAYEYLLGKEFDEARHELLAGLETNVAFHKMQLNPEVVSRLMAEIRGAA